MLIIGDYSDPHVAQVAQRLRLAGHVCRVVDRFRPERYSIIFENQKPEFLIDGLIVLPTEVPVIWWRWKHAFRKKDKEITNAESGEYFESEWRHFVRSIYLAYPEAVKLNDVTNGWPNYKPYQIFEAIRAGFNVPKTWISNDPVHLRKTGLNQKIFKPLTSVSPFSDQLLLTTPVSDDDIQANAIELQKCPGIFQERIIKEHEVRFLLFENKAFAFKVKHVKTKNGQADYRATLFKNSYEEITPQPNWIKCGRSFLQRTGLQYGIFDLIVSDRTNDVYFLECNRDGQWLWLQEYASEDLASSFAEMMAAIGRNRGHLKEPAG